MSSLHNEKHPAVETTWALNTFPCSSEWRQLAERRPELVISSVVTGVSGNNSECFTVQLITLGLSYCVQ